MAPSAGADAGPEASPRLGARDASLAAAGETPLLDRLRAEGALDLGAARLRLAAAAGFCYGVERAVALALRARADHPGRRLWLTGEIVHHPAVQRRLADLGVATLEGRDLARLDAIAPGDVALVPAFGSPLAELERLEARGCAIVDTTCGSVMAVWKQVERLARGGFTVVVHGKAEHEETRATCSRIARAGGAWVAVRDLAEAAAVADAVRGALAPAALLERLPPGATSSGFRPERDLERIGCAQQTTMLASESLAVADLLREALRARHGEAELARRFRAHDTVCSATQDRQDALRLLLAEGLDLVLVVGGRASSNGGHLRDIAAAACPTFQVEDARGLVSCELIRHVGGGGAALEARGWLPARAPARIGLSAAASTPDEVLEDVVARLAALLGAPRPS